MGKSAHTKALEKIASTPSEFGIEDVEGYAIEMKLYNHGRVIAAPDIVFFCRDHTLWLIEYKGNGNGEGQDRAQQQLATASSWFGRYTPYELSKIHTKIIAGNDGQYKGVLRSKA